MARSIRGCHFKDDNGAGEALSYLELGGVKNNHSQHIGYIYITCLGVRTIPALERRVRGGKWTPIGVTNTSVQCLTTLSDTSLAQPTVTGWASLGWLKSSLPADLPIIAGRGQLGLDSWTSSPQSPEVLVLLLHLTWPWLKRLFQKITVKKIPQGILFLQRD